MSRKKILLVHDSITTLMMQHGEEYNVETGFHCGHSDSITRPIKDAEPLIRARSRLQRGE